jgi:arsenite transporter
LPRFLLVGRPYRADSISLILKNKAFTQFAGLTLTERTQEQHEPPILIQVYFNSGLAYLLNRMSGEEHCVAGPSALIGVSNFFELAVAAAISLFGFNSGAALATVVGVLIEEPVMLSVVWIVNRSKGWYERGAAVRSSASTIERA